MKYTCYKTNKSFDTKQGFLNHLKSQFSSIEHAYIEEKNYTPKKCIYCKKTNQKFISFFKGYFEHCGSKTCKSLHYSESNKKIAKNRISKKINLSTTMIQQLKRLDIKEFNKKNIEIFNKKIGNITLNSYLGRHYNKPQSKCKFCGNTFVLNFRNLKRDYCRNRSCVQCSKQHYFTLKNNYSYKELNNLWFEIAKESNKKIADIEIKKYMKSPKDFHHIYNNCSDKNNTITVNGWSFFTSTNTAGLFEFLKNNFEKKDYISLIEIRCLQCNKLIEENRSLMKTNKRKFCNHTCYRTYKINHPDEYEYLEETKEKQSKIIKEKILNGGFTPNITNSWCFSRVSYKDNSFRSSWELLFFILNEDKPLKFEKLRIPYYYNNKKHIYIVDFIDDTNKCTYEIKPKIQTKNKISEIKEIALKDWCEKNYFDYKIITEDYFLNMKPYPKNIIDIIKDMGLENKLKMFIV